MDLWKWNQYFRKTNEYEINGCSMGIRVCEWEESVVNGEEGIVADSVPKLTSDTGQHWEAA